MKSTRRLDYGWRLWLSSLLILIIPLLGLYFAYDTSSRFIEEQTCQFNLNLLTHSRDVLDGRLAEMDSLGAQLLMDARVNRLLYMNRRLQKDEVYRIREAWLELSRYPLANEYLEDFFIILQGLDVVLTPSAPYVGIENFYRNFFQYGEMDFAQWQRMLSDTHHKRHWLPAAEIRLGERTLRALTYLQSMSSQTESAPEGVIVLMIDEAHIQGLLQRIELQDGGWVCVLDETGTLLTSVGGTPQWQELALDGEQGYFEAMLAGETMLVSYTRSTVNRWVYLSAVPKRVLMQKVDWLQSLLREAVVIALLAGLMLAAFAAYRNARPVREQAPLLRRSFFDRLLAGDFHSDTEIDAYLHHIRLSLRSERFGVLLVRVRYPDGPITPELLDSVARRRLALSKAATRAGHVCHPMGMYDMVVLLSLAPGEDFQRSAQGLCDALRTQGLSDAVARVSTGKPAGSLLGVHTAFLQARQAMRYFAPTDDAWCIARYEALPTTDAVYDFPLRLETRLTHLVLAGGREEATALLLEAYRQNVEERHISLDMARFYIHELFNTAVKIIGQLPEPENVLRQEVAAIDARMRDDAPLDEIHGMVLRLYDDLCQIAQAAKRSRSEEHAQDLLAFVREHAYEESLNLSVVAKAIGHTDAYVSQYFKEHTGENFSDHLERIRMERACVLLATDSMPVYRIAAEIGYGNDNTFRRAFKRRYGISPSDYRESPIRDGQ